MLIEVALGDLEGLLVKDVLIGLRRGDLDGDFEILLIFLLEFLRGVRERDLL